MKKVLFILYLLLIGCNKESKGLTVENKEVIEPATYDTMAIDSFSVGATSTDVARQILMSSQRYQDSLTNMAEKRKEEQRLQEVKSQERKPLKQENTDNKSLLTAVKTEGEHQ